MNGPEGGRYGYGLITQMVSPGKERKQMTHRVVYEVERGPIPEGMVLDHLCRNHKCVNVQHLEPVTRAENTRRGMPYWELNTVCRNNHEYTPENIYTPPGKPRRRQCRQCRAAAAKRR